MVAEAGGQRLQVRVRREGERAFQLRGLHPFLEIMGSQLHRACWLRSLPPHAKSPLPPLLTLVPSPMGPSPQATRFSARSPVHFSVYLARIPNYLGVWCFSLMVMMLVILVAVVTDGIGNI